MPKTDLVQLKTQTPPDHLTRATANAAPTANAATLFPFQSLDVYRCARELAVRVHFARARDAELRDQATRAAKSAFLNLAEGLPDDRIAMRRKYFLAPTARSTRSSRRWTSPPA